jgi:release factor glutamine methyltransferase
MNILEALNKGSAKLKRNNINSFQLDSEILLSEIIQKDRKFLILNYDKKLKKKTLENFDDLISQRSKGKPIAYLTKKKSFWKDIFEITSDVLIPRPDTEIIVEEVLKLTKNKRNLKILDIGVGSGCILLSLLKEKKNFTGVGIDISKKCIDLCRKNSLKLGLNKKVKLFNSDVDNFNYGKYDLIVSNPPYIKSCDLKYLDRDVVDFEPITALDGGTNGLSNILKVINKSSELIKIKGKLILEIGFGQKNDVKKILVNRGFYINKIVKDFSNNDRCIISTKL